MLPRAAFLAFVLAVIALLWYSDRTDREEQRATLISDMLWLEQDLRFLMGHNEELLGRFDFRRAGDAEHFETYTRTLIDNGSGLRQVLWIGMAGRLMRASPPIPDAAADGRTIPAAASSTIARSLGRPVYSSAYPTAPDDWQFEVHVPIFENGDYSGMLVGLYSINRLLKDSVPWWLAERYRIGVIDQAGTSLGLRSKVTAVASDDGYQIPFEPPGRGLALRADPYLTPTPLAGHLLSSTLVVLAVLVLASYWALRRHVQRRLAAEAALHAEYAFRKAMEDSVQTGLRARDLEGRITYVNPAFCRMVGWSAEELLGRLPPMPYWADEYLDATLTMHDLVMSGHAPSEGFEMRFKRSNGEFFDVLIHEAPLIDSHGRHTGWMGSVVDITERKRVADLARLQEERLQASARLVTMGEMASSLAHELNQPLTAIASYSAGCRNLIAAGAPVGDISEALEKCQQQAQRAGKIIRRIYEFVRRAEPKSEVCQIDALLSDLALLLEAGARSQKVQLVMRIDAALPTINVDQVLLGQALLNLMKNGIDAMRQTSEAQRKLVVHAEADHGQLLIHIADSGSGISTDVAEQLFEPFFTTKKEGLGVGLNICRSVVEAHKGRLWHTANPGGGSVFHIALPLDRQ
ncbi:MAG: PAS domain S-box protein [Gammaproteobacteria bacterium]|nr:PAS domain S-box protein [Gammaproteobacteria bacterium]MBU1646277.1 PAS domain S-box protein [Gammaproteobacteria bacterium]MBU1970820.1 PAS domain S-box protein [Gammaproteobacteria bacterium]